MEASKQAAGVSKNTFEDLTYVGKSTLGDLTKTAKEAAAKKGLMKGEQIMQPQQQQSPINSQHQNQQKQLQQHHMQHQQQQQGPPGNSLVSHGGGHGIIAGTGRDFFSSFSNEITGITSTTSSMFSGLFGKS